VVVLGEQQQHFTQSDTSQGIAGRVPWCLVVSEHSFSRQRCQMNTLDEISMVGDKVPWRENKPAEHMRTCLKCTYTKFEADQTMARGEAGVHAVMGAKGATRKGAKEKMPRGETEAPCRVSSVVRCFDHVSLFPRQQRVGVEHCLLVVVGCWPLPCRLPAAVPSVVPSSLVAG
jgi:hypothetical protein